MLAAHGAAALGFRVRLRRRRHTRDGDFERKDGLDRARERELHRATHLAGVDARRHHRPKGADIPEVGAHPSGKVPRLDAVLRCLLEVVCLRHFWHHSSPRALVFDIEGRPFAHIDFVARLVRSRQSDVVADLALERDIGDETLVCLRIETRQVAGVGIAVGVAVDDVEE